MPRLMDETTELFIEVLESRRRLAQSVHTADAFGEPADPGEIEYYKAEVADCDAQLAELRNP